MRAESINSGINFPARLSSAQPRHSDESGRHDRDWQRFNYRAHLANFSQTKRNSFFETEHISPSAPRTTFEPCQSATGAINKRHNRIQNYGLVIEACARENFPELIRAERISK